MALRPGSRTTSAALKLAPFGALSSRSLQVAPSSIERATMTSPPGTWTVAMTVRPRASSSGQP